MSHPRGRCAVLGAGALGLTAAMRLAQRGDRATVIEREELPGGLAAGFQPATDSWLDAVLSEFLPHLARINPAFEPTWVTDSWMFAAPFAQPIVTVDYREHIPPFSCPIPDLWTASMFQVYPHDRGQDYSIALAKGLVERIDQRRVEEARR